MTGSRENLSRRLEKEAEGRPKPFLSILGVLGVVGVGIAEHWTRDFTNFFTLYLLLIALVVWFGGQMWGMIVTGLVVIFWEASCFEHGLLFQGTFKAVWMLVAQPVFFVLFSRALWELHRHLHLEERHAREDPLTGLLNWRGFQEISTRELARCRRFARPSAIAYIDVDNFKTVNDASGHKAGDHILRALAHALKKHLRETDVAARVGGDEFILLFPETGAEEACEVVERARAVFLHEMGRWQWSATLSAGVVGFALPPASLHEMVDRADRCMYAVKSAGKNALRIEKGS